MTLYPSINAEDVIRFVVAEEVSDETVFRIYERLYADDKPQPLPSQVEEVAKDMGVPLKDA